MTVDTQQVGQGDLSHLLACFEYECLPTSAKPHNRRSRARWLRRIAWGLISVALLGAVATGAVLWHQGYRVFVIHTGSMTPTFAPGDVVIDRPASAHYRVGEVITVRHDGLSSDLVTHRIHDITAAGLIHTKGDANKSVDASAVLPTQVQGSVITGVTGAGYVLVFLQQPTGIWALATSLVALMLLWRVFFPTPAPVDRANHRIA